MPPIAISSVCNERMGLAPGAVLLVGRRQRRARIPTWLP
jgi:hypothetical protein